MMQNRYRIWGLSYASHEAKIKQIYRKDYSAKLCDELSEKRHNLASIGEDFNISEAVLDLITHIFGNVNLKPSPRPSSIDQIKPFHDALPLTNHQLV